MSKSVRFREIQFPIKIHQTWCEKIHDEFDRKTILGDSHESRSTVQEEETEIVDVGADLDESAHLQPSFKHPSEVFQAASEDFLQTSCVLSAAANTLGAELVASSSL